VEIKASDVKALREKTGAGMMDCKKALDESKGDVSAAEKILREWGLAGVEKRAGRSTNEGRIFIKGSDDKIAIVEIACETDFVARNAEFIAVGDKMAALAYSKNITAPTSELEDMVKEIASKIKENMTLKAVHLVTAASGEILHSYTHGEGKIVVVVKFRSDKSEAFKNDKVVAFIHDVALHIAAFNPMFLDRTKPQASWIKEQEEIFKAQVAGDEKMKGKPDKVIQGILAGKLNKLMAEVCLLDQGFVKDEKVPVSKMMAQVGKEAGAKLELVDFLYSKVGE
jgi:elongation factor Ts